VDKKLPVRGFYFSLYKTNGQDFAVVCSVIDTQYDIMWKEQKSDPAIRLGGS
jgi:hypothetical protein